MKKVLVLAPHPDDDLIGCGGSIIKHVQGGNKVHVVYMTSGDAGSLDYTKQELATIREEEAKKAATHVGVEQTTFLRNPDGYLADNRENFVALINLIREYRPDIVYLPHANDAHQDHIITNKIGMKAIGSAAGPWFQETNGKPWTVQTILGYEVWTPIQQVGYLEETTSVINQQLEALAMHTSQVKDVAYEDLVKGLHAYRGFFMGKSKYAEAFEVLRISRV
jgi:LmbE family N-acetylglucosaminyl deacetylase